MYRKPFTTGTFHSQVRSSSHHHFPRYWPFVRGIHRSPVDSPHKGQWHGALMWRRRWFETPSCSLWHHWIDCLTDTYPSSSAGALLSNNVLSWLFTSISVTQNAVGLNINLSLSDHFAAEQVASLLWPAELVRKVWYGHKDIFSHILQYCVPNF